MAILHNKKAQEGGTIPVIIIIILAVLLLIFVIWWFTSSGATLTDKIANLGGTKINVDTVKQACQAACDTNQAYQYNNVQRSVVFQDKGDTVKLTCRQLETSNTGGCLNASLVPIPGITTSSQCSSLTWKIDSPPNPSYPNGYCSDGSATPTSTTIATTITNQTGCKGTWTAGWNQIMPICEKF